MGILGSRRLDAFPVEATSFVGRRQELTEAKRLLTAARLVTLTGPGGVGKTRLAARLAGQVARAFPDGVWLVPLAAVQDDAIVPHAVADALGIRGEAGRLPLDVLIDHLLTRRLLLVLDNCEQVSGACASLAARVLAAAEGVRVLATSRHRLGLTEEHLLTVPPLRTPAPGTPLRPTSVDDFPALRLFADRAAAVVPGFAIGEENHAAVARVCNRLDGLPLAIELAAVRMRVLGVEELEERLGDSHRLLTGGSPAAPPRHQTLRSAVDWSHDLCTAPEQQAWARLAVFAGSFDLSAAEAVCAANGVDRPQVLDAVAGLVEKSILVREEGGGAVRYRLLSLLRQYGLERLDELGETAETRRRLCSHLLRLAEEGERKWFGPDQAAIVAMLRAEHDNLRAALDFCVNTPGDARQGLRLVGSLWFYWAACGAWVEVRHWWQRLIQREGGRPSGAVARAQWVHSLIPVIHNRTTAILLAGSPPDRPPRPHEVPPVEPLVEVLSAKRGTVDQLLGFHVLTRVEIACTLTFHGSPERAVPLCVETLAVCEAYGEQWVRSYVLRTLATAHWALGDHDAAIDDARTCLRLPYVTGEPDLVGRTLEIMAVIAVARQDAERTAVLQGAARRIWYDIGYNPMTAQQGSGRIGATEQKARTDLGDRGYERAHRRGQELTVPEAVAYALSDRAGLPDGAAGRSARRAGAPAVSETGLTRRELEVAELVGQGLTNRQIADALVISLRTAEGHVERILAKLGFTTRSQVAAWVHSRR